MSWLVFAEILPPEIRPKVYPLGIAIMWFMNFILTTLYEPMLSQIGTHGLLWTYAGKQSTTIYRGVSKGGTGGAIALPLFGRIEGAASGEAEPHY